MTDKIKQKIQELVGKKIPKALPLPVKYDGMVYFWGKDGEMVADCHMEDFFRIRGWGRIQDESLQDECAYWIAEAINAHADLTLEDVLKAIESVMQDKWNGNEPMLSNFQEALWNHTKQVLHLWKLNKPYDDQLEETKQFIGKILGV